MAALGLASGIVLVLLLLCLYRVLCPRNYEDALYHVKIEMDDNEMGRFVDKTVTRLVYR